MTDGQLAYRDFLSSAFWKQLAAEKKAQVGRCETCGATDLLQAHHTIYRASWYDTLPEDLQVLCRRCHAREHGICVTVGAAPRKLTDRELFFWLADEIRATLRREQKPDAEDIEWLRQMRASLEPCESIEFHFASTFHDIANQAEGWTLPLLTAEQVKQWMHDQKP